MNILNTLKGWFDSENLKEESSSHNSSEQASASHTASSSYSGQSNPDPKSNDSLSGKGGFDRLLNSVKENLHQQSEQLNKVTAELSKKSTDQANDAISSVFTSVKSVFLEQISHLKNSANTEQDTPANLDQTSNPTQSTENIDAASQSVTKSDGVISSISDTVSKSATTVLSQGKDKLHHSIEILKKPRHITPSLVGLFQQSVAAIKSKTENASETIPTANDNSANKSIKLESNVLKDNLNLNSVNSITANEKTDLSKNQSVLNETSSASRSSFDTFNEPVSSTVNEPAEVAKTQPVSSGKSPSSTPSFDVMDKSVSGAIKTDKTEFSKNRPVLTETNFDSSSSSETVNKPVSSALNRETADISKIQSVSPGKSPVSPASFDGIDQPVDAVKSEKSAVSKNQSVSTAARKESQPTIDAINEPASSAFNRESLATNKSQKASVANHETETPISVEAEAPKNVEKAAFHGQNITNSSSSATQQPLPAAEQTQFKTSHTDNTEEAIAIDTLSSPASISSMSANETIEHHNLLSKTVIPIILLLLSLFTIWWFGFNQQDSIDNTSDVVAQLPIPTEQQSRIVTSPEIKETIVDIDPVPQIEVNPVNAGSRTSQIEAQTNNNQVNSVKVPAIPTEIPKSAQITTLDDLKHEVMSKSTLSSEPIDASSSQIDVQTNNQVNSVKTPVMPKPVQTSDQENSKEESIDKPGLSPKAMPLSNLSPSLTRIQGSITSGDSLPATFTLYGLKFLEDSIQYTNNSNNIVTELAAVMKAYPKVQIRLEIHTDSRGKEDANMELTQLRANEIKNKLVNHAIEPTRIVATGMGEETPLDGNFEEAWRSRNRRVNVVVTAR